MKIGDRVRYTNPHGRTDLLGHHGTIRYINESGGISIVWDESLSGKVTTGIDKMSLTLLGEIVPSRPVQTTEPTPRVCRTIGILQRTEGVTTLLVELPTPTLDTPTSEIEIDLTGSVVGPLGRSLSFVNVPVTSSAFYPLCYTGEPVGASGITTLDGAKSHYSRHSYFVEVITTDGVPTEAKIHAR